MLDRRCFTVTSVAALMALPLLAGPAAAQEKVTLTIESWRNDDLAIWEDVILPAFEAANPNIEVKFQPTAPAQYNAIMNAKLEAGTGGDIITCRPFDLSLALFDAGHLVSREHQILITCRYIYCKP